MSEPLEPAGIVSRGLSERTSPAQKHSQEWFDAVESLRTRADNLSVRRPYTGEVDLIPLVDAVMAASERPEWGLSDSDRKFFGILNLPTNQRLYFEYELRCKLDDLAEEGRKKASKLELDMLEDEDFGEYSEDRNRLLDLAESNKMPYEIRSTLDQLAMSYVAVTRQ